MNISKLKDINPDLINRNPDNPRLIFRQDELDTLLNSIKKFGIRVPLAIYEEVPDKKYFLMDGERRWLCAKKLNMGTVPAIVEPKPTRLENILRMFNIHNVRIQWDLFAIALKLKEIQELLEKEGKPNSLKDLAAVTGVTETTVKRSFDLMELPKKYLNLLEKELQKPKSEQRFKEDFFIEMLKAIKVIENYAPVVLKKHTKADIMASFKNKYEKGVIKNIVNFRNISKIARSENAGVSIRKSVPILNKLIEDPNYSIEAAYKDSVEAAYEDRTLKRDISGLLEKLTEIKVSKIDAETIALLKKLEEAIKKIIK